MPPKWDAAREQLLREWYEFEKDPTKRKKIKAAIDEIRPYAMPRPMRGRPLSTHRGQRARASRVKEETVPRSQESLFQHKQPEA